MKTPQSQSFVEYTAFNNAFEHSWVITLMEHLRRKSIVHSPTLLTESVARIHSFPQFSVGEFIAAAITSGIRLRSGSISLEHVFAFPTPLLCFLKRGTGPTARMYLTEVIRFGRSRAIVTDDEFGNSAITIEQFRSQFSGIVLTIDDTTSATQKVGSSELREYKSQVTTEDHFLPEEQCRRIIQYCEDITFSPSRVRRSDGGRTGTVERNFRNSSSRILSDRTHPLLMDIYIRCAARANVTVDAIENIQCVRYKRGQRFRLHYDSSNAHRRRSTFLIYLNDNFEGGATVFPLLNREVTPKVGQCLRFPSSDKSGRILWPSLHGGMPIKRGAKYALNIWVTHPPL